MDHVVLSESQPVPHSHLLVREVTTPRSESLKPLVVLVAPDPQCAQALRLVLGRQYRLKEYASGEQAWASLQIDGNAAAVVCSSSLPRMSGLELIAKLRKARLPMLRQIPLCLIANTLDEDLRSRLARQQVDFVGAYDRPLVDLAAWLRNRLAPASAPAATAMATAATPPPATRADELRRWAHQHGLLEEHRRASLVIFRVVSDGVGVLGDRLGRIIRRPEMMLADSLNSVWLCIDIPLATAVRFTMRLALGAIQSGDREKARMTVSYAPLMELAEQSYDVLQSLADAEPPLKHMLIATHHWKFVIPFDAARLLVK